MHCKYYLNIQVASDISPRYSKERHRTELQDHHSRRSGAGLSAPMLVILAKHDAIRVNQHLRPSSPLEVDPNCRRETPQDKAAPELRKPICTPSRKKDQSLSGSILWLIPDPADPACWNWGSSCRWPLLPQQGWTRNNKGISHNRDTHVLAWSCRCNTTTPAFAST